jgi:hypothetical protein
MSIIYDIRNLKNCPDFKNKREDFFRTLRLKAKLNRNYEQATIARQQMEALGVTPVMQAARSIEDEQKDLMLQQQLAMKNLKTIMSDDEARRVVHILHQDDLYLLNTEFGRITSLIQGRSNITADYLKRVLERYKLHLEMTGNLGVSIPLHESTIQQLPGDLRDEWDSYARQHIDPLTGAVHSLVDLIRRTAEILNRPIPDVEQEVKQEQDMEKEQETPTTDNATPRQPFEFGKEEGAPQPQPKRRGRVNKRTGLTERRSDRFFYGFKDFEGPEFKKMRMTPPDQQNDMPPDSPPPPPQGTKRDRGDEKFMDFKKARPGADSAALRGVKRKDQAFNQMFERKAMATGALTLDQARSLARSQLEQRIQGYVPPSRDGPYRNPVLGRRGRDDVEVVVDQPPVTRARRNVTGRRRTFLTPATDVVQAEYVAADLSSLEPLRTGPPLNQQRLNIDRAAARQEIVDRMAGFVPPRRQQIVSASAPPPIEPRRRTRSQTARAMVVPDDDDMGNGLYISPQQTTSSYGAPGVFSKFSHGAGYQKKDKRVLTRDGRILGKCGAGIESNDELKTYSRFRQLGRYMLHVPSLSKSLINIKYPSLVAVPGIPQKFVSEEFIELVWELVEKGTFLKTIYNRLAEEEQDYFKFLARKCSFDQTIGLGMGKTHSKEEQDEFKRFEMLRGTVIAGNNSPEVLNELRQFILKFLMEKRIPKQQGHDLLYEMACLKVV